MHVFRPVSGRPRGRLFEMLIAAPVVAIAAVGLAQFFCLVIAGENLAQAATAGAREAALPKATYQSVTAAVRRRLGGASYAGAIDPVLVHVDGRAVYGLVRPQSGEEVAVTVSVASDSATTDLLGHFGLTLFEPELSIRRSLRVR